MPIDDILNSDGSLKSAYQMQKEENDRIDAIRYYVPPIRDYRPVQDDTSHYVIEAPDPIQPSESFERPSPLSPPSPFGG